MQYNIRDTDLYRQTEALCTSLRLPGAGVISDAAEVSAHDTHVVFAGTLVDSLTGLPPTRVCSTELLTGDTRVLTFGPNTDRLPKFSPDGQQIAFLSDRHQPGDFQLHLLNPATGASRAAPLVHGWVEYLHWSPNGRQILLGVAGHGSDVSGGQGAVTTRRCDESPSSWIPSVEFGDESYRWRRAWVYDIESGQIRPVSAANINIWESAWCGNELIAAVASPGPGEGLWYTARLHLIDTTVSSSREIYSPQNQLGWPSASPSGAHLTIVEALCSDRWIVAGDLRLIDTHSGHCQCVNTLGVDITYTEWRSDRHLLLAGHRRFESVVGLYDVASNRFSEIWSSSEVTGGGRYISLSGLNDTGDCVLVGEGFLRAPEIAIIRRGSYCSVKSFDHGYFEHTHANIQAVDQITWQAPDGLEIDGWLLRPGRGAPHALIMNIHGGPVGHWRPTWLGRGGASVLMLLKRGYAVFLPNPRGSSGRGQSFVRHVLGEMGGADAQDLLAGLNHLVATGIADPRRLGVTGGSYGGFMAAWLITQDSRFAAAVPVAPVTNQVTAHLLSNIPHFVELFLADAYDNPGGKYFQRSPIMHVRKVNTPTLNICGALDRCTPPEEAIQFHNALLANGVKSVLVTYPEEGHGIRHFPAAIDYAARLVRWFEEHMPADVRKPST